MIGKLVLKDFKTHKDTVLEFSPGVNIITGDSGQGKTNILLGLNWVKDNRPLGIGCIRRGQSSALVGMEVVDGKETCGVVRRRSKSENVYDIVKEGIDIDPFLAGSTPPKEISEILNLSDINVQKQRDQHFLVYSPPGQVATYIRSITKLDEIDQVTKLLSGKIHSGKKEISRRQAELKSTNEKLVILSKIDLELLESKIAEAKGRILEIELIKEKIERISPIVEALKTLEECWIHLPDTVDQIFEDIDFGQASIDKLSSRLSELKTLVDKIKKIEACKIVLPKNLEVLSTSKQASEKYNDIHKRIEILLGLLEDIRNVESKIDNNGKRLKQLEHEEKLLKEQLSACPSCGVELTEESKRVLLER